jgi:sarcosine oxidase subunit alpha
LSLQVNRLDNASEHKFHGTAIDRSRVVRFRLNGIPIEGYVGDTVLSAALACGIIGAGIHLGHALGLDERFAPHVVPAGSRSDKRLMLPMDRMPAIDGLDLVTLGAQVQVGLMNRLTQLFRGRVSSLGVQIDAGRPDPWLDEVPERTLDADVVIVGGGVAGMSAARAAALSGSRVVLIERRPTLGGDAAYFGAVGDEDKPEAVIARQASALAALSGVTVMLASAAFAVSGDVVMVHRVTQPDGRPVGETVAIKAPRIVLATGSFERLPVFAGNRLPGVVSANAAFHRARQYGIWQGNTAAFATSSSVPYRLAMQASDAGIKTARLADIRPHPQSRFIEFSKAYGITMAPGLIVESAAPADGKHGGLSVQMAEAANGFHREIEPLIVEQLLVCGGFQPDLTLWLMAGGSSRFAPSTGQLQARGELLGIELAGAAAGYHTTAACISSGGAAIARLFKRKAADITELHIDPLYETPDAPAPIGELAPEQSAPAYLDGGGGLHIRAAQPHKSRLPLLGHKAPALPQLAAGVLSVGEVAASVQLGTIAEAMAGIVASERGVTPIDLVAPGAEHTRPVEAAPHLGIPAYLAGRFGPQAQLWTIHAEDSRAFDAGCLIYVNSDSIDPRHAVGVIVGKAPTGIGSLALIGRTPLASGNRLIVKDVSGAASVHLGEIIPPSA